MADRRLVSGDQIRDEEYNKLTNLVCEDGDALIAFTGMARNDDGSFETQDWLLDALRVCAVPEPLIDPTLRRLEERATTDVAAMSASDKRLTIVATGLRRHQEGVEAFFYRLSNYEWHASQLPQATFQTTYPPPLDSGRAFAAGRPSAVRENDLERLEELLRDGRARPDLANAALAVLRRAADLDPERKIGKQALSCYLQADSPFIMNSYHPERAETISYGASLLDVRPGHETIQPDLAFQMMFVPDDEPEGEPRPMLNVASVGRNDPCWCGSGKKFKKCHGA
jgi:hypothetical protein